MVHVHQPTFLATSVRCAFDMAMPPHRHAPARMACTRAQTRGCLLACQLVVKRAETYAECLEGRHGVLVVHGERVPAGLQAKQQGGSEANGALEHEQ